MRHSLLETGERKLSRRQFTQVPQIAPVEIATHMQSNRACNFAMFTDYRDVLNSV